MLKISLALCTCVDVLPASIKADDGQNGRKKNRQESDEHEHQQATDEKIQDGANVKHPSHACDLLAAEELCRAAGGAADKRVVTCALHLCRMWWWRHWLRCACEFGV